MCIIKFLSIQRIMVSAHFGYFVNGCTLNHGKTTQALQLSALECYNFSQTHTIG